MLSIEFDEVKNRINVKKHGISFEEAATVFQDPLLLITEDRTKCRRQVEQEQQSFCSVLSQDKNQP